MSEKTSPGKGNIALSDLTDETNRLLFSDSMLYTIVRQELYDEFSQPVIDAYQKAIEGLEMDIYDTFMDAGCGGGGVVERVAQAGHKGSIIGVNLFDKAYLAKEAKLAAWGYSNVHFIKSDIRKIVLPDGQPMPSQSIDAMTCNFVLNHVEHPDKALDELERVLVSGGRLSVSLRGTQNMINHWESIAEVAKSLGHSVPESYYLPFSIEDARSRLSRFRIIDELSYEDKRPLHIKDYGWFDYFQSMASVLSRSVAGEALSNGIVLPKETDSDIRAAINQLIKPRFDKEIDAKGYYTDYVHDGVIVCQKN